MAGNDNNNDTNDDNDNTDVKMKLKEEKTDDVDDKHEVDSTENKTVLTNIVDASLVEEEENRTFRQKCLDNGLYIRSTEETEWVRGVIILFRTRWHFKVDMFEFGMLGYLFQIWLKFNKKMVYKDLGQDANMAQKSNLAFCQQIVKILNDLVKAESIADVKEFNAFHGIIENCMNYQEATNALTNSPIGIKWLYYQQMGMNVNALLVYRKQLYAYCSRINASSIYVIRYYGIYKEPPNRIIGKTPLVTIKEYHEQVGGQGRRGRSRKII